MIPREECAEAAALLRQATGVRRVVFSLQDGIAHYDDAVLEERAAGAACVAALMGAAGLSAEVFDLGSPQGVIVYGEDVQLIVRPVGAELLMIVVVDLESSGHDVYRQVRTVARRMEERAAEPGLV